MRVSALERRLGIETFVSKTLGIGGSIRYIPEDFVVEEVLLDGSKAELEPKIPEQILGEGRYLTCALVKRNWDTILAVRRIAQRLDIGEHRIRVAGIKDKKAITTQHISIENIRAERLRHVRVNGISLFPLRYSANMVYPHMLYGNAFHLTVRNIPQSDILIRRRISNVKRELDASGGIPNFFGHQRFGTIRPITHLVGQAIVQKNVKKAAFLFLAKSSAHEHPQARKARQRLLKTENFREALNDFPRGFLYERLMLQHLVKHPKEYVGAFRRLPQRLCNLFLQAYQSYLFNRFLSQRFLQNIPLNEPQIGDYVLRTDSHGLPMKSYVRANSNNLQKLRRAAKRRQMYIAIPLIGFKQPASEGIQGEIEQSIIESEKITPKDFHVGSLLGRKGAGTLRAATAPIIDLNLRRLTRDELNVGKKKLQINFVLYRGCYATVVLREFVKPSNLIKAGF